MLHTPIILKTSESEPLPTDVPIYYLLTKDGLFRCRNHPFFTSSVRVKDEWPRELASHKPNLTIRYPKLPRHLMERVLGFFSVIGKRHQSEAAALFVWNKNTSQVEVIIPKQVGIVGKSWGRDHYYYPMEVKYEIPNLPPHQVLIGDIHSHLNMSAFASFTDQDDEQYGAGLHIIVGRIDMEPPEFHCDVTVDGARFGVKIGDIADYKRRVKEKYVPTEWFGQFTWEEYKYTYKSWDNDEYGFGHRGYGLGPKTIPVKQLPLP